MPRLTRRLTIFCIGLALTGAIGLVSGPTPAAEVAPTRIADLTYDVYVGGLHVYAFDVEMTLAPESYRVTASGETRGMVSLVSTWTVHLAAEGLDRNGRVTPQRYVAETQWQSRQRKLQLGFRADGGYDLQQDPPPEPDPDIEGELPEKLPEGIVDPLSFAIAASRSLAETGRCAQTVPVFDGQRRSNVIVKQVGETVLPPNNYSIYQGPAMRCSLGVERISGFRKSLRLKQEAKGPAAPPILWMATMQKDLPPIPVRYEGEIALGKIVIHLTAAAFRSVPD